MTALETLLDAIDEMSAACDHGTTHWDGCEAEHPRCAVYLASDAVRLAGIPVPAELGESACQWTYDHDCDYYATGCGQAFCLMDGTPKENEYRFCPACGGRIEVTDGD